MDRQKTAVQLAQELTQVRAQKISQIRTRIASGKYTIQSRRVAKVLLEPEFDEATSVVQ